MKTLRFITFWAAVVILPFGSALLVYKVLKTRSKTCNPQDSSRLQRVA